jgi:membrane-associated protease RseP (regulator of RpoE activity)
VTPTASRPRPSPRRWIGRQVARAGSRLNLALLLVTIVTTLITGASFAAAPGGWPGWLGVVARGLPYAAAVLLILGGHEMGHYVACRLYRVPASLPYFIPGPPLIGFGTFGAVIRIRGLVPHRRALFDIGLAGPLAGFVLTVPVLAAGVLRASLADTPGEPGSLVLGRTLLARLLILLLRPEAADASLVVGPLYVAGWLGTLVTALNLFPVGQLDGGHVLYALSTRAHGLVSRGVAAAMVGLAAWAWLAEASPVWFAWTVVLLLLRDRHPPVLHALRPPGPGRTALALVGLIVFALCFSPVPLRVGG